MNSANKISTTALLLISLLPLLAAGATAGEFDDTARAAVTALDTGRLIEAARLFEKAAGEDRSRSGEISFDWAWTYMLMGHFDMKDRDYEGSDWAFSKAAQIAPEQIEAFGGRWLFTRLTVFHKRLAKAEKKKRKTDWKDLVEFAQKTVSIARGLPVANYQLGLAMEKYGQPEKAVQQYRIASGRGVDVTASLSDLREMARLVAIGISLRYTNPRQPHPLQKESTQGEFETIKSGPFVIHHRNRKLAERAGRALQYYLSLPSAGGIVDISGSISETVDIYIHTDKEEYAGAT